MLRPQTGLEAKILAWPRSTGFGFSLGLQGLDSASNIWHLTSLVKIRAVKLTR